MKAVYPAASRRIRFGPQEICGAIILKGERLKGLVERTDRLKALLGARLRLCRN